MSNLLSGVLFGIFAVLALETIGSLLSQRLKFPYTRLSPISLLLYAIAASLASRGIIADPLKSIAVGWLAGLIVGLADSTLGWWISWHLGAGRLKPELASSSGIAKIVFRVTMLAGVVGVLAVLLLGFIARLIGQTTA